MKNEEVRCGKNVARLLCTHVISGATTSSLHMHHVTQPDCKSTWSLRKQNQELFRSCSVSSRTSFIAQLSPSLPPRDLFVN